MTAPVSRRMIELPGTEALWLLEGVSQGQLVPVRPQTVAGFRPDRDEAAR
ncbi:hypothetical protein ACFVW8_21580 [Streptomyces sp. NPDC058221]